MPNPLNNSLSPFMKYLASIPAETTCRLPPLAKLSQQLNISVASLREQMEVARMMGLIEVHPRTGIQKVKFAFTHTVVLSLLYGNEAGEEAFLQISDLRKHIEAAYWMEAASQLTQANVDQLNQIVIKAFIKLHSRPPQIPVEEHKAFHLVMYQKVNNPYVQGILEAYWIMYEYTGMAVYTDLQYLEQVWLYHRRMVEALNKSELDAGYRIFMEHIDLMSQRVLKDKRHRFE
jgi:DNA-binding FadR family transcriptional regulator